MDFDLSWILLGLPVAFVMGWLACVVNKGRGLGPDL